tara:strand:+ start:896 stop:1198 length:303 start_codon:yes stop_codon:yes gene_type:complete
MLRVFAPSHKESALQIIALLIATYTEDMGMNITDKKSLKKIMNDLISVDETGAWNLSKEGFKRANQYAYAGFEIIHKKFKYASNSAETVKGILDIINKKI